ncbi:XynB2 [Paenibacillus mucilaginosus 3016]|uniref:XynB2 n=1 Tax=Paenibacillus mucilaginosus 3016 TaxID=1116391 RepID=H6NDF3_9BACL|nr:glycoside hydrolase family 43 protein [Paenibacillus mucilaginosus]AFC30666.1 XynB2 [Paenibacillus mucilaginosus 3016]WFA19277.1 glycoside hydrolase family 43 protein [Paenibacillus mucilaginosus]
MTMIMNPVLRGFNPDPSICRVGDDYYIATSTFEWFPGVQIHHSRDLVHWRLLTHALTRPSQLDMKGNADSCGVWAPCLSYDNGTFYLLFTDVKSRIGAYKDTHNYLVTAQNIEGPWSEPVYLNSSGFDPSLFHDDDGRKWLVNMLWDFRKGHNRFAGIVLQEYAAEEQRLVGPVRHIFRGTELRFTEGPHLYKRNGYYYLLTAEGGTEYNHAVTMARSKSIEGPYEVDPQNPILTSAGRPELALQKAGHGCLVETPAGEWYMAHLCARPVKDHLCVLGRETALQRCEWTADGWLRLASGGPVPEETVQAPGLPESPFEPEPETDDFDSPKLNVHWSTLRVPADPSWLSLSERPGYLRLKGRESLISTHRQSLIARRQQAFRFEAETCLEYEPENYLQMAGLILYYDTKDYVYLRVTHHEELGVCLGILQSRNGVYDELLERDIPWTGRCRFRLKVEVNRELAQFYYGEEDAAWTPVGEPVDITHLSDDFPEYIRFTGNFVGLCAQDLGGLAKPADFDYFTYREIR